MSVSGKSANRTTKFDSTLFLEIIRSHLTKYIMGVNNTKLQNTKHNIIKDGFLLKMDGFEESHYRGSTESRKGPF